MTVLNNKQIICLKMCPLCLFSGRDTCVVMVDQTQQGSRRLTHTSVYGGMTQRSRLHACWNNATLLCRCEFNVYQ